MRREVTVKVPRHTTARAATARPMRPRDIICSEVSLRVWGDFFSPPETFLFFCVRPLLGDMEEDMGESLGSHEGLSASNPVDEMDTGINEVSSLWMLVVPELAL